MSYFKKISTCKSVYLNVILSLLTLFPCTIQAKVVPVPLKVGDLVCEYKTDPISIDVANPRLSWKLITQQRNVRQTCYEIRVGTNAAALVKGKSLLWSSGKVFSDQSVLVNYDGPALPSTQKCYWQVRVWDNKKQVSPWSMVNYWKMGLLKPADWKAQWIQSGFSSDTTGGPSPMFRKVFKAEHKVKAAYLYITAHGIYEARLNGNRVGDDYFTPGFTSYDKRLQYQVYDVTSQLKKGYNAIGVTLGDGWYRGYTYDRKKDVYGNRLALLVQLEVIYTDGRRQYFISDKSWKVTTGPIRKASFYDGEIYDATRELPGWATAAYNDAAWDGVKVNDSVTGHLIAMEGPPVKKHEQFFPVKVFTTLQGDRVIDFGQNLVGWVRFKLKGKAGDTLRLFHGEVLDKDGNFYNKNLRTAKQEVTYIFKGDTAETYEPHFTFMGFRYVKVVGYNGPLDSANVSAFAVYSDMAQTGTFTTSNKLINQLQHNILWSQKGNFIDIPTDCPQRDERMGWTGDAQVFCQTATFNMDVAGFFTKWLKDLAADQLKDGAVPYVIPNVLDSTYAAASGWSDVATIVPWDIYLAYGDKRVLEQQYDSMKAWVNYIQAHANNNLWDTGNHFGDWLSYTGTDYEDGAAITDKNLIAQAFYAHSAQLLINAAIALGKIDDAHKYIQLLANIKKAFQGEYVTPNGRMISGTQTSYVLALNFNLLPDNVRDWAVKRLLDNIDDYDGHITTGFLGTPYICQVLTRFGHTDEAYNLLLQKTYPSWLYPVINGATTIWERWDGIKPDKTLEDPAMNSFNHYAYGAIGEWMYSVIGGINASESSPGFHKIIISPRPGGNLTNASAALETMYGRVTCAWNISNYIFTLDVTVPPNTTSHVILPSVSGNVTENERDINADNDISNLLKTGDDVQLDIGSGKYHFVYVLKHPISKK